MKLLERHLQIFAVRNNSQSPIDINFIHWSDIIKKKRDVYMSACYTLPFGSTILYKIKASWSEH